MSSELISSRNLKSILIVLITCGTLVSSAFTVGQDSWIAALLMAVVFLPILLIYSRICALFPGKGLFEIIEEVFCPVISLIVTGLMTLYAGVVSAVVLQHYTQFSVVISLQETPKVPIVLFVLAASLYLASKGVQLLGRWSLIVCILILINFIFTIALSLNVIEPLHILPILDHDLTDILANSYTIGSIAVGECVVVMAIFRYAKPNTSPYKVYISAIFIGVLLFTCVNLRNLMVLGSALDQAAQFATYMTARILHIGNFMERMESSISFIYILLGITKLALYLTVTAMGVSHLMKLKNHKNVLISTGFLVGAASIFTFKNAMEMFNLIWIYQTLSIPFQVGLPLIIWIAAEIKQHRAKGEGSAQAIDHP